MATIVYKDQEPVYTTPGRRRWFLANRERTKSKHLAGDVVTHEPGVKTPEHFHKSENFVYILDGTAEISFGGEVHHLDKDSLVFLEPEELHSIKNDGNTQLKFIEAFAPAADYDTYAPDGKPLAGKYILESKTQKME